MPDFFSVKQLAYLFYIDQIFVIVFLGLFMFNDEITICVLIINLGLLTIMVLYNNVQGAQLYC